MELYAAGFNAWNQLSFGNGSHRSDSSGGSNLEPDDVTSFARNLSAETIGRPVSHLSYTLGTQTLFSLDAERNASGKMKGLIPHWHHQSRRTVRFW